MSELENVARTIVGNLHQSYLYKVITEWFEQDTLQIREDLGISSYSETVTNPADLFEKVRMHILTKAFQDDVTIEFLMNVPQWVGFRVDKDSIDTGEQAIQAAKQSVMALIWVMLIPRAIIGHTVLPEDFEQQGVGTTVESLLQSNESRKQLDTIMSQELDRRGIGAGFFNISDILMGYEIDDTKKIERLSILFALVLLKATEFPFDLDSVFPLDESALIKETEAYIITMHAQNALNNKIKGNSSSRPFDWPLIGTARVFAGIINTLDVMRKYSARMSTCSLFTITVEGQTQPWPESEFVLFLLKEIADYYTELLRARSGKGKNEELKGFIDFLKGEDIEITSRVMATSDKSGSLHEELSECKRRARIGETPQISPERRFKVVLSTLKQSLENAQSSKVSSEEIVDQIATSFDAISDVIRKLQDSLGSEVDKFTEELCFETSFKILDLLGLVSYLPELPWITRFIAEESTMIDISSGEISELRDGQRIKRTVSAFAGAIAFLVLQTRI